MLDHQQVINQTLNSTLRTRIVKCILKRKVSNSIDVLLMLLRPLTMHNTNHLHLRRIKSMLFSNLKRLISIVSLVVSVRMINTLSSIMTVNQLSSFTRITLIRPLRHHLMTISGNNRLVPTRVTLLLLRANILKMLLRNILGTRLTKISLIRTLLHLNLNNNLILIEYIKVGLSRSIQQTTNVIMIERILISMVSSLTILKLTHKHSNVLRFLLHRALLRQVLMNVLNVTMNLRNLLGNLNATHTLTHILPDLLSLLIQRHRTILFLYLLGRGLLHMKISRLLTVLLKHRIIISRVLHPILILNMTMKHTRTRSLLNRNILNRINTISDNDGATNRLMTQNILNLQRGTKTHRHQSKGRRYRRTGGRRSSLSNLKRTNLTLLLTETKNNTDLLLKHQLKYKVLFLVYRD